ncbi:MAG TPA: alkaline phosphatase family protein [Kofleriaceae bacterium]|nr:alkaline phosphatase family protein [Kofleriaceae bacterium]
MTAGPAPLVVIDAVGLTPSMLGPDTPHLSALALDGFRAQLDPILPAVTCSAQATLLTGALPREHGVVGNGWYFRDLAEVLFWRQSNHLVGGDKLWDAARRARPDLRTAVLLWWFNMYSSAELSVTVRPIYPADGRKIPALYSHPSGLAASLEAELGRFPFFQFWGPSAGLPSSDWIARAALELFRRERPGLTLVYLPHLDYDLQRFGPAHPRARQAVRELDGVAGLLIDGVRAEGAEVVVLSEYGIEEASGAVHLNRALRQHGLLAVRETLGWELLDAGASRAFAVADHQIAHVYVRDPADLARVAQIVRAQRGVARLFDAEGKAELGLDHPRSGELVAVAEPGHWFTYYYWLDDARAPDFARTVDIHRKPGYDPVELFLDPDRPLVKGRVLVNLARKKAGMRYLMDVIPLRADLVKGTHGRADVAPEHGPLLISSSRKGARDRLAMTEVKDFLLGLLLD